MQHKRLLENAVEGTFEYKLKSKFIDTIETLLDAASTCFQAKNKKLMLEALTYINIIALQTRELSLYKSTTNLIAHVHLHFKSPNSKALEYFKKLRDAATEDQDHNTKTIAYN